MSNSEHPDHELKDVTAAVRDLAEIMHSTGLSQIEVGFGAISIRLKSGESRKISVPAHSHVEERPALPAVAIETDRGFVITAPMIGTYYTSPAPGEPLFVHVGERIEVGQIIGIIEAMKIMNEIPADRAGVVVEILATNAQAVEYGSPLLRVSSDEAGE